MQTGNGGRSGDTHFQDGALSVSFLFSPRMAANTSFMDDFHRSPDRLPKMQNQHIVDTPLMLMFRMQSLPLGRIKAAKMSVTHNSNQINFQWPCIQDQNLLMLRWHSLTEWGSDCNAFFFAWKDCHSVGYAYKGPNQVSFSILTSTRIIDALLTYIFGMGQRLYRSLSCQ